MSESPLDPGVIERLRQLTPPGEPDVLAEVLGIFLEEVPRRIQRLRIALAAGDIVEVARSAHSLKGSAGNIGAADLYDICTRLDAQARDGDLTGAGTLVDEMGAEFGKVESAIHRLIGA